MTGMGKRKACLEMDQAHRVSQQLKLNHGVERGATAERWRVIHLSKEIDRDGNDGVGWRLGL